MKPITRACKHCKTRFEPKGENMIVCTIECSIAYMKTLKEKKNKALLLNNYRKNKIIKDKLKTLSQHKKELQVLVNKYVRIRDKGKQCISCMRFLPDKYDAGHFWSSGGNPSVSFDLDNIHGQCVYCNQHQHGNLLDYKDALIVKIGQKRFDDLEQRRTQPRKFTIPEIMELKELFKQKIKLA